MANANDPQDDKTMRMPRRDLELDDQSTMRMPLPDWDDEKTIRVSRRSVDDEKTIDVQRHDLGEEQTIRVQRAQQDWESTVRAPLQSLRDPGMVILPLDDPHEQPTIRMPRPVSQLAASAPATGPAPRAAAASALREMPKLSPASPLSSKLLWAGLGVVALVLAAVAWMLIRG